MAQLDPAQPLVASRQRDAEKAFAVLLLFYPSSHRRQFAGEMRQTFRDLYRDYSQENSRPVIFWSKLVLDTVQSAINEYISLIRSPHIMKTYTQKSASTKALLAGVVLMAPIPLLLLVTLISQRLGLQLGGAGWYGIGFVAQVILPLIALAINLAVLIRSARTKSVSSATIVFICVTFAWILFIFGPLTFGHS